MLPDHSIFTLKISILNLVDLHPHEMVVPKLLGRLVDEIKRSTVLMNPIIVDERTLVILDGMHRYYALKELGYEYIVACLIDYMNPNIEVRNWYREISCGLSFEDVMALVGREYSITSSRLEDALKELAEKRIIAAIVEKKSHRTFMVIPDRKMHVKELYDEILKIENLFVEMGNAKISYQADTLMFDSSTAEFVLATPIITKQDVISTALNNMVFAPKTTRHIIPARPLFVHIPLSLLKRGDEDLELIQRNKILNTILRQRTLMKIKGKIRIDRFYGEDHLYIFI